MIRVLYLDNEEALLEICQRYLERDPEFQVEIESDGFSAIERIKREEFDVILSDYDMPGLNGIEFLRLVRVTNPVIPFIIISGKGREELVIQSLNEGADFYVQKGGDIRSQFTELIHKIRHAVEKRRNFQALRVSEERFRALTEQSPDIVLRFDKNHRILYANPRFTEISGIHPEDIIGVDYRTILKSKQRVRVWEEQVESVLRTGKPSRTEFRVKGSLWLDRILFPEYGIDNSIEGITLSSRDITARKRSEEEREKTLQNLIAQQNFLNALLDAIPIPVHWKDKSRRYLSCNRAFTTLTGISHEEIAGRTYEEVWTESEAKLCDHYDSLILENGSLETYETRLTDRSGVIHEVIHSKNLFYDHQGNVAGIVGSFQDMTSYNTLIRDLKNREELFRMIITRSSDIFIIISSNLEINYISPGVEPISGFLTEEIIGPIRNVVHPDDLQRVTTQLERVIQNSSLTERAEFRSLKRDGSYMILDGEAINCLENPAINGILITARDITARKQTEEKLDESLIQQEILDQLVRERTEEVSRLLDLKDNLIMSIAHELRTPLTPIIALLPLLEDEESTANRKTALKVIQSNTGKIVAIVQRILQLARLGTIYKFTDLCQINIHDFIDCICKAHYPVAQKSDVTIINSIPPNILLLSSPSHLESVLDNLISNAIKYSESGGRIFISAHTDSDDLILIIRDEGIGMNSDEIKMIFEPFFKTDKSRHDRTSPGLGLSITRRLVMALGGSISIQSDGPGKGTEVTLTLKNR